MHGRCLQQESTRRLNRRRQCPQRGRRRLVAANPQGPAPASAPRLSPMPDSRLQKGSPCIGPTMHINMGMDSKKLIREAYKAILRDLAFSSSVAGTIPRIFFWLGQINPHTLNSMMVPSQAPMPMMRLGRENVVSNILKVNALTKRP